METTRYYIIIKLLFKQENGFVPRIRDHFIDLP